MLLLKSSQLQSTRALAHQTGSPLVDDGTRLLELLRRGATHFPARDWAAAIEAAERRSARAAQLRLMWPLD